ncbi:MAG: hypothetical protein LKJ17_11940 [Oscillospiraceae bacterium]|jgi:hypothetical protein|nr:hypothetical protein [Oscillospiraceae bacterium]
MAGKHSKNPSGKQKKLKDAVESVQAKESNLNQNHNTKQVSMGPNTHR